MPGNRRAAEVERDAVAAGDDLDDVRIEVLVHASSIGVHSVAMDARRTRDQERGRPGPISCGRQLRLVALHVDHDVVRPAQPRSCATSAMRSVPDAIGVASSLRATAPARADQVAARCARRRSRRALRRQRCGTRVDAPTGSSAGRRDRSSGLRRQARRAHSAPGMTTLNHGRSTSRSSGSIGSSSARFLFAASPGCRRGSGKRADPRGTPAAAAPSRTAERALAQRAGENVAGAQSSFVSPGRPPHD